MIFEQFILNSQAEFVSASHEPLYNRDSETSSE